MKVTPKVMPIAKALALVETWEDCPPEFDGYSTDEATDLVAALAAALAEAVTAGWETVQITTDGLDIRVEPSTGVMVGWFLDDNLAYQYQVDGGEADLHLTAVYLGDMADLTTEQTRVLTGIVAEVASAHPAPFGVIDGSGTFENDDETVWFAVPQFEGLAEFRAKLVTALTGAGFELAGHHARLPGDGGGAAHGHGSPLGADHHARDHRRRRRHPLRCRVRRQLGRVPPVRGG
jgi:hypothetical protein